MELAKMEVAIWAAVLRFRPWVTNSIGHRIYIDPADKRAWRMARGGGATDRAAVNVWQSLVEILRPDLVLDIGANYGEVVLSTTYAGAEIHAFEPNPPVADRLERSMRGVGRVHRVAASSVEGVSRLGLRTGTSSGLASLERTGTSEIEVPTVRLDDFDFGPNRLLFKIDVEGHEIQVLRGMSELLARTPKWIGLVEGPVVFDAPFSQHVTAKDHIIASEPIHL